MSWLSVLVKQHEKLESPLNFWWWGGLAAISAVVKDQIYLERGTYKLYCNVYIMFHADSGLKKGPPVNMAKQLVSAVGNTKIITGRASVQGILKKLGTGQTEPGKKPNLTSTGFICLSELSAGIVEDPVATKILTDLYDRHYNAGEWESLLKGEQFQLKDPTVTMLSATNESMSEEFLSNHAIKGGFLARTFIIHEHKRNTLNSLIVPMSDPPNYVDAARYLKELSTLKGPFRPLGSLSRSDDYPHERQKHGETVFYSNAGLRYDDWYERFWAEVEDQDVKDSTGTLNRFGDSVLKVAMLLSLSESPNMIIETHHIDAAIEMCERLVGNTRKATMGKQGMSKAAPLKGLILNEFIYKPDHRITREQLVRKLWMHYSNKQEIDDIMVSLCETGMIEMITVGGDVVFEMSPTQFQAMKRFLDGKLK